MHLRNAQALQYIHPDYIRDYSANFDEIMRASKKQPPLAKQSVPAFFQSKEVKSSSIGNQTSALQTIEPASSMLSKVDGGRFRTIN